MYIEYFYWLVFCYCSVSLLSQYAHLNLLDKILAELIKVKDSIDTPITTGRLIVPVEETS